MLEDLFAALPVLIGAFIVWSLRRIRKAERAAQQPARRARRIVVDGSNVMHWSGEPSLKVLKAVLRDLKRRGYTPVVFFDANAGYVLEDRYLRAEDFARLLGLGDNAVQVAESGTPADEILLTYAAKSALPIVSNDRFRDWCVRFPQVRKARRLIGGTFQNGAVRWNGRF